MEEKSFRFFWSRCQYHLWDSICFSLGLTYETQDVPVSDSLTRPGLLWTQFCLSVQFLRIPSLSLLIIKSVMWPVYWHVSALKSIVNTHTFFSLLFLFPCIAYHPLGGTQEAGIQPYFYPTKNLCQKIGSPEPPSSIGYDRVIPPPHVLWLIWFLPWLVFGHGCLVKLC